jgi:type I restriction enzyme M protein
VLFESGAAAAIRQRLLQTCDVHTLLRLPTGLFYAQGVKANVLFFDKVAPKRNGSSRSLWVYNLRGKRVSLKQNPLRHEDLQDFVQCFNPGRRQKRQEGQSEAQHPLWRRFDVSALLQRKDNRLDLSWVVATSPRTSEVRAELDEIATLIEADLRAALNQIAKVTSPAPQK